MHGTRIAARDPDDSNSLAIEVIGDELVVFDPVRMHYHTMNATAVAVWQACEHAPDLEAAVHRALEHHPGLSEVATRQVISELAELGLVEFDRGRWTHRVCRRDAIKLSVAAAFGAIGLPVIASLTVPSNQASASPSCPAGYTCFSGECCPCSGKVCACGGPVCSDDDDCLGGLVCINNGTCGILCT